MHMSSRSGATSSNSSSDRPVVFQKSIKHGGRIYASQVKISHKGQKYLVLTEEVRDPETGQIKKHTICVFESHLKEYFAMMQETVLFLRSTRDPNSVAGMSATAVQPAITESVKPARTTSAKPAVKSLPKPPVAKATASTARTVKTACRAISKSR